jgi:hypothetical protein
LIEAHDGGLGPVEISKDADAAAEADALAHPELALFPTIQLSHCACPLPR